MIIEKVTCDCCGKSMRIETDDMKYLEKKKAEFQKKHGNCKKLPAETGRKKEAA